MAMEQPLTKETANPNAATAAASAFMRREPSTSLSSAAAAAALKARPTTPTNVAEVQSKRALRRSPSASSTAGRDRGKAPAELRRAPSTASMTERTFRSPSPGQSPAPRTSDVPPVPGLPKDGRPSSSRQTGHTTLQTQPFRTASQKLKDGQQASWFGAATTSNPANARKSDAVLQSPPRGGEARSGSASPSINFSYPRTSIESPTPSPTEPVMVYDANSRRMVPRHEPLARSQSVRDAPDKSTKKKKPGITRARSHSSKAPLDRTRAADLEPPPPMAAQRRDGPARPVRSQSVDSQPKEPLTARPSGDGPGSQISREPAAGVEGPANLGLEAADAATGMPPSEPPHASALTEKASIAQYDPVADEPVVEETESTRQHGLIDAVPVRSAQAAHDTDKEPIRQEPEAAEPKIWAEESSEPQHLEIPTERSSRARVHSESPARSAHFAPTTDRLLVRHEPPPRSLSPRKSALKHSSSVRGASPSDDSSEASEPLSSLNSKDETARKKSARVSFHDDRNVVVGESAETPEAGSPVVPSPQPKKPWHNIVGRHKRDATPLSDDETMTPRPALPLFGSVREKKAREPDSERPLVRPSERAWSPPPALSASTPEQSGPDSADLAGPSTDSAIGSVLFPESSSRNEANISRTREPLPPVVTSVEGSGYDSSSVVSSEDELAHADAPEPSESVDPGLSTVPEVPSREGERVEGSQQTGENETENLEQNGVPGKQLNGPADAETTSRPTTGKQSEDIPSISIVHPTPLAHEDSQSSPENEYFDVPGTFPHEHKTSRADSATPSPVEQASSTYALVTEGSPGDAGAELASPSTPALLDDTVAPAHMDDIQEEEEGTCDSSIYSDAYEDMSDAEAGGFMSLDAVLTASPDSNAPRLYEKATRPPQEVTALDTSVFPEEGQQEPPVAQSDWENAKAYWRSLTVEKRRQLEKEALEEAGEDADHETMEKTKKMKKKRRSTDRPISGSVPGQAAHPDRVYQIEPGTSWALEDQDYTSKASKDIQTQQTAPVTASKLRKSMRGEPPVKADTSTSQQSKTMRPNRASGDAQGAATTKTTARPASYQPPTTAETIKSAKRPLSADGSPAAGAPASSSMKPTLRRRGSDSSESSFKRSRAGGQGFGFRTTMRASSQEPDSATAARGSGRFSFRSLSPTGSAFRRSSVASPPPPTTGPSRMRQSMRTGSSQEKQSKKLGGFRLSPGKKGNKAKGGSRFADSSDDEDGPTRPPFRSRFADSSDEEDAPVSAPKTAIPKTMRTSKGANSAAAAALGVPVRSDSPDLPDSDDEIIQPKRNASVNGANGRAGEGLQRSRSGRGSLISSTTPGHVGIDGVGTRPTHQRRGSFMSTILRRKKDNTGKISRDVTESAARRDTRLERSTEQLNIIRSNSGSQPRLHKQSPSWPLPDENEDEDDNQPTEVPGRANGASERPATSAGPGTGAVPKTSFLKRRSTSHQAMANTGMPPQADTTVPAEAHKKKKFGTLRKMFGLND